MASDIEVFLPQPKPQVRYYGAVARETGRGLANIVEFTASRNFYLVVVELPQVQFCDARVNWNVNDYGEVTIQGQITPAATFANMPIGHRTKRIKLCPTEPWGMSFHFPGPLDWGSASFT